MVYAEMRKQTAYLCQEMIVALIYNVHPCFVDAGYSENRLLNITISDKTTAISIEKNI